MRKRYYYIAYYRHTSIYITIYDICRCANVLYNTNYLQ